MSSMLKKTGGLAFKPKAGRRGGGATPAATASSSQAPSASVSASVVASTAGTPVPEPSTTTQTSTPTPTPAPAPAPAPVPTPTSMVAPSAKITDVTPPSSNESERVSVRAPQPTAQSKTTAGPQPTPEPTVPLLKPTITPTVESTSASKEVGTPRHPQHAPVANIATSNVAPITASPESSIPTPARDIPSAASSTSAAESLATPEPSAPTATSSRHRLPTAPPSPPAAPDTITAVAAPDEPSSSTAAAAAPKKKRAPRKRSAPSAEGEVEGEGDPAAPKKKRVYRKRKQPTTEDGENAVAAAEGEEEETTQPRKKPSRPRKRAPTPEDAENQQVDHTTTKMAELTRDLGIGKPFKHAEAIAERARLARLEAKQRKLDKQKRALGLLPDDEMDVDSGSGTPTAGGNRRAGASGGVDATTMGVGVDTSAGVGYEVVDGQIVVNQSSLVVDRHAGQDMQNLVTVEEDEFTHHTTSSSYRRPSRNVANAWSDDETERFYRLLEMFGCDFESIAAMFPGKNRRMVKCKFNREERLRPKRVNAAIMVRGAQKPVPIDIEEYKGFQKQWQETEDIMREHERLAEEHRLDIKRLKAERRAAGLADDSEEEEGVVEVVEGEGEGEGDGNGNGQPSSSGGGGDDNAQGNEAVAEDQNNTVMTVETGLAG